MRDIAGAIFFFIIGSAFVLAGLYIIKSNRRIANKGVKTEAEIIEYVKEKKKENYFYFPVYRFRLTDGTIITQKGDLGTGRKPNKTKENIYYHIEDKEILIVSESELKKSAFPKFAIIFGLFFVIIALASGFKTYFFN
ncbi:hypothetical protein POV27_06530 [Aureisphaera galaxeae]|uniref:DUF3592 domain-containing protein n=1 Tax=Aureisphaera galaxeae TaxID=1538023 RepID=UPI00234FD4DD|nr:DUF3592 domain-containing protein [Aureisphaera galaxeae]MDC8003699.1 hypothetical protein [Aureisphaera galaxeae]